MSRNTFSMITFFTPQPYELNKPHYLAIAMSDYWMDRFRRFFLTSDDGSIDLSTGSVDQRFKDDFEREFTVEFDLDSELGVLLSTRRVPQDMLAATLDEVTALEKTEKMVTSDSSEEMRYALLQHAKEGTLLGQIFLKWKLLNEPEEIC